MEPMPQGTGSQHTASAATGIRQADLEAWGRLHSLALQVAGGLAARPEPDEAPSLRHRQRVHVHAWPELRGGHPCAPALAIVGPAVVGALDGTVHDLP